jgi:hypothetical protein
MMLCANARCGAHPAWLYTLEAREKADGETAVEAGSRRPKTRDGSLSTTTADSTTSASAEADVVVSFKNANGLSADGIVGTSTWEKLVSWQDRCPDLPSPYTQALLWRRPSAPPRKTVSSSCTHSASALIHR